MSKTNAFWVALDNAKRRGWKTPPTKNIPCGEQAWLNFWKQCEEYERNQNAGRPVVPHRSA